MSSQIDNIIFFLFLVPISFFSSSHWSNKTMKHVFYDAGHVQRSKMQHMGFIPVSSHFSVGDHFYIAMV